MEDTKTTVKLGTPTIRSGLPQLAPKGEFGQRGSKYDQYIEPAIGLRPGEGYVEIPISEGTQKQGINTVRAAIKRLAPNEGLEVGKLDGGGLAIFRPLS